MKRFMVLIIMVLILIGLKIYAPSAPKVDYITQEEPDILIDESSENLITETIEEDEEDPEPEPEQEAIFTYSPLSDEVTEKITGISYKENDQVKIDDLVYVQITHWGFDHKEHTGEIILNKKVAHEVVEIFKELYDSKFPIEKIRIIDEYEADDELSMLDNNSSAFCYRVDRLQ